MSTPQLESLKQGTGSNPNDSRPRVCNLEENIKCSRIRRNRRKERKVGELFSDSKCQ